MSAETIRAFVHEDELEHLLEAVGNDESPRVQPSAREHSYLPGSIQLHYSGSNLHYDFDELATIPSSLPNSMNPVLCERRSGRLQELAVLDLNVVVFPGDTLPIRLRDRKWIDHLQQQIQAADRPEGGLVQFGVLTTLPRNHLGARQSWTRRGVGPRRLSRISQRLIAELGDLDNLSNDDDDDNNATNAGTLVAFAGSGTRQERQQQQEQAEHRSSSSSSGSSSSNSSSSAETNSVAAPTGRNYSALSDSSSQEWVRVPPPEVEREEVPTSLEPPALTENNDSPSDRERLLAVETANADDRHSTSSSHSPPPLLPRRHEMWSSSDDDQSDLPGLLQGTDELPLRESNDTSMPAMESRASRDQDDVSESTHPSLPELIPGDVGRQDDSSMEMDSPQALPSVQFRLGLPPQRPEVGQSTTRMSLSDLLAQHRARRLRLQIQDQRQRRERALNHHLRRTRRQLDVPPFNSQTDNWQSYSRRIGIQMLDFMRAVSSIPSPFDNLGGSALDDHSNENDNIGRVGTIVTVMYTHHEDDSGEEGVPGGPNPSRQLIVTAVGTSRFRIVSSYDEGDENGRNSTRREPGSFQRFVVEEIWEECMRSPSIPLPNRSAHRQEGLLQNLSMVTPVAKHVYSRVWPWKLASIIRESLERIPTFSGVAQSLKEMEEQKGIKSEAARRLHQPLYFSYWLASNLPLQQNEQLEILELMSTVERLQYIQKKILEAEHSESIIHCKNCDIPLTKAIHMFTVGGADGTTGNYVNRNGYVHQTTTVRQLVEDEVRYSGRPETRDSWFPGYSHQIMSCGFCMSHLGWKFVKVSRDEAEDTPDRPRIFFGLTASSIATYVPNTSRTNGDREENRNHDDREMRRLNPFRGFGISALDHIGLP